MKREILVDARWLLPPEPMEQVLAALDRLRPDERIRFLLHREPFPLYEMLEKLGYRHETHAIEEDCFAILIEAGTS